MSIAYRRDGPAATMGRKLCGRRFAGRGRFLAPALAAGALLLASAAGYAADTPARTLAIGLGADVTSADPHFANVGPNNTVAWHVFEALTHVDPDTRLVPGLATAWRAINPTTWEFSLRKDVRFHDGSAFDARDVESSLKRVSAVAEKGGQFGSFVRPITAIEIVDPHTIRLRTATPHAVLPQDLASIFIVPRAMGNSGTEDFNAGRAAIGTGPFRLASFARGSRVDLVRNDAYWGEKPAWERVTLRILPQDAPRLAALLAGDVDAIENVPTSDLARIAKDKRLHVARRVSWRTIFIHLDQQREAPPGVADKSGKPLARNPLRDPRVRSALALAIDRKALVDKVMEGMAVPAGNLVSPPVFAHDPKLVATPFDPAAARKLLAEAGYGEGFRLTLATPNNRYVNDEQVAQTVAQMWTRIGVQVTRVEALPAATYFTKGRNGDFGVALLGWGSFAGDLALRALVASPLPAKGMGSWNWGGYSNAEVDRLVEQSLATVEQAKREALAKEAMSIAMKEHAVILLHHQIASWAMRAELTYPGRTDEYTLAQSFKPR